MSGWIPMEWMKPDKTGIYIVTTKGSALHGPRVILAVWDQPEGQLTFDSDNKGKWKWMGQDEVSAWMPLPEPFKAEEPQTDCSWK